MSSTATNLTKVLRDALLDVYCTTVLVFYKILHNNKHVLFVFSCMHSPCLYSSYADVQRIATASPQSHRAANRVVLLESSAMRCGDAQLLQRSIGDAVCEAGESVVRCRQIAAPQRTRAADVEVRERRHLREHSRWKRGGGSDC